MKDFKFLPTFQVELRDQSPTHKKDVAEKPEYKLMKDIWDGDLLGKHTIDLEKLNKYVNFQVK